MENVKETAFSGEDLDADIAGGDESTKSERKRQRERQRRSDLANAFDELAAILSLIDPEELSESMSNRQQKRRRKSVGDAADLDTVDNAGSTRLDLIGKSVDVLRRLHNENTELRRVHGRNEEEKDDKEVLVMVPMLTPVDNDHGRGMTSSPSETAARATAPFPHQSYYSHQSPPSLGPPAMPYHQGPPPPDYRGYYASAANHLPPHMHRNYGPSYQNGANWMGGGHQSYYQQPPPNQYPSPPQHYENAQSSRSIHSQGSAG